MKLSLFLLLAAVAVGLSLLGCSGKPPVTSVPPSEYQELSDFAAQEHLDWMFEVEIDHTETGLATTVWYCAHLGNASKPEPLHTAGECNGDRATAIMDTIMDWKAKKYFEKH